MGSKWLIHRASDPPDSPAAHQEKAKFFIHEERDGKRLSYRTYREFNHISTLGSARGFRVSGPTGQKPTRSELGPAHLAEIGSKFISRGINLR